MELSTYEVVRPFFKQLCVLDFLSITVGFGAVAKVTKPTTQVTVFLGLLNSGAVLSKEVSLGGRC
jgi:hypothetical protein